jgi:ABC-type multidrug transport system fused ATPase/permease subunit
VQVEFFDRFRVSELTNLLTTELAAVRSVVLDNVSRDRGFRSISEVLGTFFILFKLAPRLAPVLGILITSVSIGAGKEHISAGRGRELYETAMSALNIACQINKEGKLRVHGSVAKCLVQWRTCLSSKGASWDPCVTFINPILADSPLGSSLERHLEGLWLWYEATILSTSFSAAVCLVSVSISSTVACY